MDGDGTHGGGRLLYVYIYYGENVDFRGSMLLAQLPIKLLQRNCGEEKWVFERGRFA